MSTKENKKLYGQFIKEWNELGGDIAKLRSWYEKYYVPGYIYHSISRGDMNREQTIQFCATVLSAFPDFSYSIDDMIAEGDKVVTRYTIKATHKGTFQGIPATGKHVSIKGSDVYKIEGKKILEWWEFNDMLGLLTQVGTFPGGAPKK